MVCGFVLALSGVIVLMILKNHFLGPVAHNIAISAAIFGFLLYIIGRIFVAAQRQKKKRNSCTSISPKDDL